MNEQPKNQPKQEKQEPIVNVNVNKILIQEAIEKKDFNTALKKLLEEQAEKLEQEKNQALQDQALQFEQEKKQQLAGFNAKLPQIIEQKTQEAIQKKLEEGQLYSKSGLEAVLNHARVKAQAELEQRLEEKDTAQSALQEETVVLKKQVESLSSTVQGLQETNKSLQNSVVELTDKLRNQEKIQITQEKIQEILDTIESPQSVNSLLEDVFIPVIEANYSDGTQISIKNYVILMLKSVKTFTPLLEEFFVPGSENSLNLKLPATAEAKECIENLQSNLAKIQDLITTGFGDDFDLNSEKNGSLPTTFQSQLEVFEALNKVLTRLN